MGYKTAIEWTNHTFNPWWGCTRVSAGCDFCYAETWANRFDHDVWGPGKPRRTMGAAYWNQPLAWNAEACKQGVRSRVFCASMADVFDPEGPEEERAKLWDVIRRTPWLDWQLLTKRPQLVKRYLPEDWGDGYSNVWLGTSVEDERVIKRIKALTSVPAIVHFLSLEPLIGPLPNLPLDDIEWVIVGGESGTTPRDMPVEWVREIRAQCEATQTAFFFKQWGGRDKKGRGRELDGFYYNDFPEVNLPENWPPIAEPQNDVRSARHRRNNAVATR